MNTQYVCPHHSESGEHIVLFEGDSIDINSMSHITMPEAMSSAIALCDGRRGEWVTRFLHAL